MSEPTTTVTDYLVAGLAAALGLRLAALARGGGDAGPWLWALGFAAVSLGAALGGTIHGFGPRLGPRPRARLWTATLLAVLAGNGLLAAATAAAALPAAAAPFALVASAALFAVFAAAAIARPQFRIVTVHGTIAMALVAGFCLYARSRGPALWTAWVLAAVAVAALGAAIQARRVAPRPWFNHNDLYHVLQAVGLLLLYRGAAMAAT